METTGNQFHRIIKCIEMLATTPTDLFDADDEELTMNLNEALKKITESDKKKLTAFQTRINAILPI